MKSNDGRFSLPGRTNTANSFLGYSMLRVALRSMQYEEGRARGHAGFDCQEPLDSVLFCPRVRGGHHDDGIEHKRGLFQRFSIFAPPASPLSLSFCVYPEGVTGHKIPHPPFAGDSHARRRQDVGNSLVGFSLFAYTPSSLSLTLPFFPFFFDRRAYPAHRESGLASAGRDIPTVHPRPFAALFYSLWQCAPIRFL